MNTLITYARTHTSTPTHTNTLKDNVHVEIMKNYLAKICTKPYQNNGICNVVIHLTD